MNVIKLFLISFSLFLSALSAQAEVWRITTLEWPPFVCSRCPENGAAAKALRESLAKSGIQVRFEFYSWTKAMHLGKNPEYVGYYPAWPEEIKGTFISSKALFTSPVGFVEPRNKPLQWNQLSDLKGKLIGTSQDYGNTVEFNRLVAEGVIRTEVVESDDTNMRKVALGRLDGALLDINNARYFLSLSLKNISGRININSKVIENKSLHMVFNAHHADQAVKFQEILKTADFQKSVDEYLKKYLRK